VAFVQVDRPREGPEAPPRPTAGIVHSRPQDAELLEHRCYEYA